jgi:hypothetical protein
MMSTQTRPQSIAIKLLLQTLIVWIALLALPAAALAAFSVTESNLGNQTVSTRDLLAADIDGDGYIDIVVGNQSTGFPRHLNGGHEPDYFLH